MWFNEHYFQLKPSHNFLPCSFLPQLKISSLYYLLIQQLKNFEELFFLKKTGEKKTVQKNMPNAVCCPQIIENVNYLCAVEKECGRLQQMGEKKTFKLLNWKENVLCCCSGLHWNVKRKFRWFGAVNWWPFPELSVVGEAAYLAAAGYCVFRLAG